MPSFNTKSQLNLLRISRHGAAAVLPAKALFRRLGVLFDILAFFSVFTVAIEHDRAEKFRSYQYSGALPVNAIAMQL